MALRLEEVAVPIARAGEIVKAYVQAARIDHWFKNVLVLPGAALALYFSHEGSWAMLGAVVLALLATGLVASANYVINEWLDADFDRFHPLKKSRPSVSGRLSGRGVLIAWALLLLAGLGVASLVSFRVMLAELSLGVMGVVYNVPPLRTKDRPYLDVLSESVNNPIRLLVGWLAIMGSPLPPASLVFAYWMVGAFLMSVKRYSEMRFLGSAELAGRYRRSFRFYTPEMLLICAFFYSTCAAFVLGVFLVKYRVELLVTLPFLALGFAWYLKIGMKPDSAAQRPERLYREGGFTAYLVFVVTLLVLAFVVDVPALEWFLLLPEY